MKADENQPYCDQYFINPLIHSKFEFDFCILEKILFKMHIDSFKEKKNHYLRKRTKHGQIYNKKVQ